MGRGVAQDLGPGYAGASTWESGKAGSMGLACGKFPTRYLVSGPAARKGDDEEKLLEKNKEDF